MKMSCFLDFYIFYVSHCCIQSVYISSLSQRPFSNRICFCFVITWGKSCVKPHDRMYMYLPSSSMFNDTPNIPIQKRSILLKRSFDMSFLFPYIITQVLITPWPFKENP